MKSHVQFLVCALVLLGVSSAFGAAFTVDAGGGGTHTTFDGAWAAAMGTAGEFDTISFLDSGTYNVPATLVATTGNGGVAISAPGQTPTIVLNGAIGIDQQSTIFGETVSIIADGPGTPITIQHAGTGPAIACGVTGPQNGYATLALGNLVIDKLSSDSVNGQASHIHIRSAGIDPAFISGAQVEHFLVNLTLQGGAVTTFSSAIQVESQGFVDASGAIAKVTMSNINFFNVGGTTSAALLGIAPPIDVRADLGCNFSIAAARPAVDGSLLTIADYSGANAPTVDFVDCFFGNNGGRNVFDRLHVISTTTSFGSFGFLSANNPRPTYRFFNPTIFNPGPVAFNLADTGANVEIYGTSDGSPTATKLSLDSWMALSIIPFRISSGSLSLFDCTATAAGTANLMIDGFLNNGANIPWPEPPVINYTRCEWVGTAGTYNAAGDMNGGGPIINATNTIWRGDSTGAAGGAIISTAAGTGGSNEGPTGASGAANSVTLTHCTIANTSTTAAGLIIGANTGVYGDGTLFDPSGASPPAMSGPLSLLQGPVGVPNVSWQGTPGVTNFFGPSGEAPGTINQDPNLDANARLLAPSAAIGAATGSVTTEDIDLDSRPLGPETTPDIGADETALSNDTTPPVIVLDGDNPVEIDCNGPAYVEPGFTATDDVDGDISGDVVVGGDIVDTNTPGDYFITYNVSDAAGNAATEVVRTVTVLNNCNVLTVSVVGPLAREVTEGEELVMQVQVSGVNGSIQDIQWFYDDGSKVAVAIPGADSLIYTINEVALEDAGEYYCEVSDDFDTVQSNPITVTVAPGVPLTGGLGLALIASLCGAAGAAMVRRRK